MEDTDLDGNLENSERSYYHQDHLGGTALITDSTGLVSQVYDYYPYGSELLDSQPTGASVPAEHSFTDKELDDDLGLYYFEARWYDSEIGRFSGQDPAQLDNRVFKLITDPQSLNFYAYSRNNPINLVDPSGEFWSELKSYAAGIGNSWASNNLFGFGRSNSSNSYFNAGQTTGDLLSIVTGAIEVITGGTIAGGGGTAGVALAPVSGGISVPAISGTSIVTGAVVGGHGLGVMMSGGDNLGQDIQSAIKNNDYGTTPGGREYTQHGYNRANQRDISGDQIDNTINNYTDTFDASKGKTGYYDSNNDITVITGSEGEIVTTHYGKPVQLSN